MTSSGAIPFGVALRAIFSGFSGVQSDESPDRYSDVRKCPFFESLSDNQLFQILKQSAIRKFSTGIRISSERTNGTSFFVILSGAAEISSNGMHMGIIQRGDCVGEGVFFTDKNSNMETVIASGEVVALELTKDALGSMSDEVKASIEKVLLHALFKKLQRSNVLNELLHKQWISSLSR